MEALVVDLAMHRLSDVVIQALNELEQPHRSSNTRNIGMRFRKLHQQGVINREEYLLIQSRILLNEFCYKMEDTCGEGVMCGFSFYSQDQNKLYYGAGANLPSIIKDCWHKSAPTVDMEKDHHYDNDIFVVNRLEEWHDDWERFAPVYMKTNVKSIISKRLRYKEFTFGTFETYFPYEYGPTDEIIDLIRKEVQPIKEQLYEIRKEMVEVISSAPDHIILNQTIQFS